jgi:hypothetical protein
VERLVMSPYRIEGYAIVSAEGMLATAERAMPDSIRNDADQRQFQDALDRAALVLHGRHSHEGGPNAGARRRLVLTRQTATIAPHPTLPRALMWNPAGLPFEAACRASGVTEGVVAILGGTDTFGLFLAIGYDAFHLSRAARARLPGGRPVFPGVPESTPEAVLASHGLKPGPVRVLDAEAGVTLVDWTR